MELRAVSRPREVREMGRWKMGGFDLDGTLVTGSTVLAHVGRRLGRLAEVQDLIYGYESYQLSNHEVSIEAARMFSGLSRADLLDLLEGIPQLPDIREMITSLKRRGVWVVIATVTFEFAAEWFARTYDFDNYSGIVLEFDRAGRATGGIVQHMSEDSKVAFVIAEAHRLGVDLKDVFYIGDSRSDLPTFRRVGFAVAINATPEAKACANVSIDTQSLQDALQLVPKLF